MSKDYLRYTEELDEMYNEYKKMFPKEKIAITWEQFIGQFDE